MDLGLKDRVAVVTGGSQGIGKATAVRLAAEGASVVIVARGKEQLDKVAAAIEADGGRVAVVPADVSTPEGCAKVVDETLRIFGRLDILINNAGTSSRGPFEAATDDVWQRDFDLKLFAAIRLSRLAIPHMQQRRWGRIVNLTNIGSKQPAAQSMPTSVTRAAGLAFTKALSKEFGKDGILVNTVCIGTIKAKQHETKAEKLGVPVESLYAERVKNVPLGRVREAEEAANVIAFLASEAASYVTGTSVNMDGGASAVL